MGASHRGTTAAALLVAGLIGSPVAVAKPEPFPVPRSTGAIQVDGVLDEPAWAAALRLDLNYETSPGENIPPPAETTCLLTFDDSTLYVGCLAQDPNPAAIRARLTDRDSAWDDDFVGIVLDTFNDERRAFEFFVNPLGVQMDLVQDDINGNEDSSWDAIWSSAGKITETGYAVEMGIPFSSLRFQRGTGAQTWGVDLLRIYPRDRRVRIGLNSLQRDVSCYLCQASKIVGFEGARPGRNLEVNPTFTASRNDSIEGFPDGGLARGDEDYEPGLDVRWGFTPNLTLNATANPDFSQVEADVARLDVNEQFALFFPERRPFFLEGADYFETRINAVHTRTVADPAWGAKITGKENSNALGGFVALDERTNLLVPGSQGSALTQIAEDSLAGVLRYRRDIGKSSAVGGLLTAREAGDYHNYVFGVDTLLRPTDQDRISVQLLGSSTEYPAEIVAEFACPDPTTGCDPGLVQPAGSFDGLAVSAGYSHNRRNWSARASYTDYGDDFRSDLGFLPQVGFSQIVAGGEYRWWGDDGQWYNRITVGGDWDVTNEQDGTLIEREIEGWTWIGGAMQSFLFLGVGHRTRVFNEVSFPQDFVNWSFEFRPAADLMVYVHGGYGDRVDFSYAPQPGEARQGKQLDLTPGLRYNIGRHVKADLRHNRRQLGLEQGRLFRADLTELRLVYQFNVRAFLRLITQYSVVDRDPSLFEFTVPEEDRDLFNQLLFSYKVNPRTALFVGYTDDRTNSGADPLTGDPLVVDGLVHTGRSLFAKIGYAWVP